MNTDGPAFAPHADPAEAEAFDAVLQDTHAGNAATGVTREVEAADSRTSAEGDPHGAIAGRAHAAHTEATLTAAEDAQSDLAPPAAADAADAVPREAESAYTVVIAAGPAHADSSYAASHDTGGAADETGDTVAAGNARAEDPCGARRLAWYLRRERDAQHAVAGRAPAEHAETLQAFARHAGILDATADHARVLEAVAFHAGNRSRDVVDARRKSAVRAEHAHTSGGVAPDPDGDWIAIDVDWLLPTVRWLESFHTCHGVLPLCLGYYRISKKAGQVRLPFRSVPPPPPWRRTSRGEGERLPNERRRTLHYPAGRGQHRYEIPSRFIRRDGRRATRRRESDSGVIRVQALAPDSAEGCRQN